MSRSCICIFYVLWLTRITTLMVGVSTFKPRLDKTLKGDYEQTDLDPDN